MKAHTQLTVSFLVNSPGSPIHTMVLHMGKVCLSISVSPINMMPSVYAQGLDFYEILYPFKLLFGINYHISYLMMFYWLEAI